MSTRFGEVAGDYDEVRPDYPDSIASQILAYLGGPPPSVTEIGAGTGKATAMFARLGAPLTCVEPDPRMAARLTGRFPTAQVVISDFASWRPPAGGVPVLAGALVWHLLDPRRRCADVHAALRPDGVVALVGRKYGYADARQRAALEGAFLGNGYPFRLRPNEWIADELRRAGLFTDVALSRHDTVRPLAGGQFLRLVTTFSPFRALAGDARKRLLEALGKAVEATGGIVGMRLETTLSLARRR